MKNILICVEHLTGWPIARATADQTANSVIQFVEEEIITLFGPPKTIVSENGSGFTAHNFKEFLKRNGIKCCPVVAYAPMSNGKVERMVSTIKRSLVRMVREFPDHWPS